MAGGQPRRPALTGNLQGALWMVASGFAFTVYLVMAKELSAAANPLFLAFWRALIALLVTVPVLVRHGAGYLRTDRFGLIFTRSLFGTLGFALSLLAVSDFFSLPLSQFNALSFSRPLFVTILAALLLGEAVGRHRWGAVGVGFVGVLVMAVPGALFFWVPGVEAGVTLDLASLLAIGSAFAFAGAIILVKRLSASHAPGQLLIWANLLSALLLLPFAVIYWAELSLGEWLLVIAMSLAGLAGQFCYITAMSVGDASFLSPMDYLRLPMAAVADFLLFRLLPGVFVWIGAGIIVASTLYITLRESRRTVPRSRGDP